ncbi:MAG: Lpp/OprI family alanine-zipper lipoprotein [Ectothiorhodospiraceae bacterium]|jgi:hypothetical protein
MSQTLKTLLKLSAAAMSLSLVVGCATQASNDMQAQIDEAKSQAMDAQQTATDAQAKAEAAMQAANDAKEMAQEAQGLAKSAQFTADQNSKKIDRMFKKSMYK